MVNFCSDPGVRGGTSYWDGDQVKFAPGAADSIDTAAHELTHAVIDRTADLDYECQSGALNEAIADMMAYNLDPEDTTYGEDRDGGAIRDYADPTLHGQPGHVDDYDAMPNDDDNDHGGVHTNSGIPNHAYYLLVQSVGRDHAEQILYRALTEKLESDSNFEDFRTAMIESARELYGQDEVDGVDEAFAEVGLDGNVGSARAGGMLRRPVMTGRPVRSLGMTMRAAILMCALALLVAAGCGDEQEGGGGNGGGGSGSGGGSARLEGPIVLRIGGGEAPRKDVITVQPDGSMQLTTLKGERSAKLKPDELSKLAAAVADADLPSIPEDSDSPEPIPDVADYRVDYQGHTIDTDQEANPEALKPVTSELQILMERYGPS